MDSRFPFPDTAGGERRLERGILRVSGRLRVVAELPTARREKSLLHETETGETGTDQAGTNENRGAMRAVTQ